MICDVDYGLLMEKLMMRWYDMDKPVYGGII